MRSVEQNFTISNILHSPVTSSLLAPNTFHSTVFLITLRLCSLLIVTDHVSHPHKTTGKFTEKRQRHTDMQQVTQSAERNNSCSFNYLETCKHCTTHATHFALTSVQPVEARDERSKGRGGSSGKVTVGETLTGPNTMVHGTAIEY